MATKKKVSEAETKEEVKAEPEKKETKKAAKKVEAASKAKFAKPTVSDFDVIISPIITEKSMSQTQTLNKATFKVKSSANKTQVKNAIERIYQVKVENVSIINVVSKNVTRGSRYHGTLGGYKKAIVTIANGEAIDLFKD